MVECNKLVSVLIKDPGLVLNGGMQYTCFFTNKRPRLVVNGGMQYACFCTNKRPGACIETVLY